MMNIKEFADKLNNREYTYEVSKEEREILKKNGWVIIVGASDDICRFLGAIEEELDCYDGGTFFLSKKGKFLPELEEHREFLQKEGLMTILEERYCNEIKALWCEDEKFSWSYSLDIPHETFIILEDGEPYCKGVIFDMKELQEIRDGFLV